MRVLLCFFLASQALILVRGTQFAVFTCPKVDGKVITGKADAKTCLDISNSCCVTSGANSVGIPPATATDNGKQQKGNLQNGGNLMSCKNKWTPTQGEYGCSISGTYSTTYYTYTCCNPNPPGMSLGAIIAIIFVLLVVIAVLAYIYFKHSKASSGKNPGTTLGDPLLANDGMVPLVVIGGGGSSPSTTVAEKHKNGEEPDSKGVRMVNHLGFNYPAKRVSAMEAESYGKISNYSPRSEIIPQDSAAEVDDSVGEFESSLGSQQAPSADFTTSDGASSIVVTTPANVCKVLIAGEARADTNSVNLALQQAEEDVRKYYKSNHITVETFVVPLSPAEMNNLDNQLPSPLSQFNAIFLVFSAKPVYVAVVGKGGKLFPVMEKLRLFGVPKKSVYFIGTGDRDAEASDDNYQTLGMSTGNLTADSALGMPKNVDEAELVSEKLRARIGPMQLSDLQDSIAAGRCFSWNLHASRAHQRILRRHMRYLAYHKPEHSVDVNQFRYAEGRGERQSRK
jgi:hypothetical protein